MTSGFASFHTSRHQHSRRQTHSRHQQREERLEDLIRTLYCAYTHPGDSLDEDDLAEIQSVIAERTGDQVKGV